jgi:hypothetical protein
VVFFDAGGDGVLRSGANVELFDTGAGWVCSVLRVECAARYGKVEVSKAGIE